jgi:Na+/H+ antiporter NhaD/arsenite permease-like protein
MVLAVIATFVLGYLAIVFEHPLRIDKTVPALIMAAVAWALIAVGLPPIYDEAGQLLQDAHATQHVLLHHVGKIAEILVFLIGAMTIIEFIDMHKGFGIITSMIKTRKKSALLWLIVWITFFLSSVLDNLTCTIVMVSLLKKLLDDREERLYFASIVIIAANAGGAWSPIGDVTTTMLWNADLVSSMALIATLFLPSAVCTFVPALMLARLPIMQGEIPEKTAVAELSDVKQANAKMMLIVGIGGLIFVPVFKTLTHLSPYVGMMLALGVVWLVSDRLSAKKDTGRISKGRASDTKLDILLDAPADLHTHEEHPVTAKYALSKIDISSILFFLGILLTVASLESLHVLKAFATSLEGIFPATKEMMPFMTGADAIAILLGYGSAVVDNVPLVAAAQGMYNGTFPLDHKMWHLLAYTAGTGGSMLVIGSAAGVAAMGMENIDFMWYFRKIAFPTMVGFLMGAIVFLVTYPAISGMLGLSVAAH